MLQRHAAHVGLDVIAITNHNQTLAGRLGRAAAQPSTGPLVLVGEEITGRDYHLIARRHRAARQLGSAGSRRDRRCARAGRCGHRRASDARVCRGLRRRLRWPSSTALEVAHPDSTPVQPLRRSSRSSISERWRGTPTSPPSARPTSTPADRWGCAARTCSSASAARRVSIEAIRDVAVPSVAARAAACAGDQSSSASSSRIATRWLRRMRASRRRSRCSSSGSSLVALALVGTAADDFPTPREFLPVGFFPPPCAHV